jgi:HEPN domain-containing protein
MHKLTREWVRKAEDDWAIIQIARAEPRPYRDPICFHCQQAAEKYLKALLQEAGLPVPRTHNLESLLADLMTSHPSLRGTRRGLRFLTDFAVDARYPGKTASKRQMESALRWCERVRQKCRMLLGVKPPRLRKRT